jgi:hypothetical protein
MQAIAVPIAVPLKYPWVSHKDKRFECFFLSLRSWFFDSKIK